MTHCPLCADTGGLQIWQDAGWRVVRVADDAFPAFYRVICNDHIAEFSDLPGPKRQRCMDLVGVVERVLIECLQPTKINLAALGNMVPHLHWHVVARFDWDSHFPQPIWGSAQRQVQPAPIARLPVRLDELDALLAAALAAV